MIKNKKGFTLIELIIVMAIIGILAVVAVIAIGSKSSEARDARRLWDASQIQYAFNLHAVDHPDDYLDGPADATNILLNELINRGDLTYLSLDNVLDPVSSRTETCFTGVGQYRCDRAGGYTLFDALDSDSDHMGTFSQYSIGMKLENTESIASINRPKFAWVEAAYAATCPNGVCELLDGEDIFNCPQDCACNHDDICDLGAGENSLNCDDCAIGAPPAEDENDWLLITPSGISREVIEDSGGGFPIGS